jgi:hypothetical protein
VSGTASDDTPRVEDLAPGGGELAPGLLVAGRYAIRRYLAGGGMGAVYEADDREPRGERSTTALRSLVRSGPVRADRDAAPDRHVRP